MESHEYDDAVLPYRTEPQDLHRFLVARARGRPLNQIRTLNFAPKNFEGTIAAADALALISDKAGALSPLGRRYAAVTESERPALMRELLESFPPYGLLIEAVLAAGTLQPTTLEWIETWWASHRFGSSESNRSEAAPVFAKFVEAAGLGSYIQGRKGHASRIEWAEDASSWLHAPQPEPHPGSSAGHPRAETGPNVPAAPDFHNSYLPAAPFARSGDTALERGRSTENVLAWQLAPGREVTLRLPADLSGSERARLLRIIELLLQA